MSNYHVSLGFGKLPDAGLDEFTGAVITGLTGNAAFPNPAVSIADLTAAKTEYENALNAMAQSLSEKSVL